MTHTEITAQTRENKKPKQLRSLGYIPANIYGEGGSTALQIKQNDFIKLYNQAGTSGLLYLTITGEKKARPALIEEAQVDPISGNFLHVSFHQVSLKEKITAEIPVELEGEFKVSGGVMVQVKDMVEVEALPTDLPEKFVLSIEGLKEIGQALTYKDLQYDKAKVTVIMGESGEDEPLVIVQEQKEEVEEAPSVAEEGAEGSEAPAPEATEASAESQE